MGDEIGRSASYEAVRAALDGDADAEAYTWWCAWCGDALREDAHGLVRYCNPTCREAAKNDRIRQRLAEARAGRTCRECGEAFVAKSATKAFCNRKCSWRWRVRHGRPW